MTFSTSDNTVSYRDSFSSIDALVTFPTRSLVETDEQRRRFELLRLAFFVLKLRKYDCETKERQLASAHIDHQLRCSLLRHAIFQQVVTLTQLGARTQALQLVNTCRT